MAAIWPTSMTVPELETTMRAPTVRMKSMLKYMHSCISGELSATMRSAFVKSMQMESAAAPNFFFSYSSRAKPLTTRIARTFSSMDSLSLS